MINTVPYKSIQSVGTSLGVQAAAHIDLAFRAILKGDGVHIDEHVARLKTGTPHPFGNFAMINDTTDPNVTERAVKPLLDCGAPQAALYLAPASVAVQERLAALGFESHDPMPAMVVESDALAATSLPAGYTFERIGAGAESDVWAEAFAVGYELPRKIGDYFAPNVVSATTAPDAPMQFFAVRNDGRMVCTSMLYLAEGLAGIYCVATVPEERKKGLAAHATAEPLRLARKLGYNVGVLQSSHEGHNVYRKLGFKDVGEVPLYVRMPG